MKRIEAARIAEQGQKVSNRMAREFGKLRAPEGFARTEEQSRRAFMGLLHAVRPRSAPKSISCIPLDDANLSILTSPAAIGRTFGIMGSRQIVHSGIITDRTRPDELHFTPILEGGGVPLKDFGGVDELGRIMLEIGGLTQHPETGTAAADTARGTASELGHTVQGISALTDPALLRALQNGDHWAHAWAETTGVGRSVTNRNHGVSAFTVQTADGPIENGFSHEFVFDGPCRSMMLVDHEAITDMPESGNLGVSAMELAVGMGSMAAQSQLERSGPAFDEYLMRTMQLI